MSECTLASSQIDINANNVIYSAKFLDTTNLLGWTVIWCGGLLYEL
jgi:hypothetical protein